MKTTKILIFIAIYIIAYACKSSSTPNENMLNVSDETLPSIYAKYDTTIELGSINFDSKSGTITSTQNPLKCLCENISKASDFEIININYVQNWSSGDNRSKYKVIYNRINCEIKEIKESSNVIESFSNVNDSIIMLACKDNECNSLACLRQFSNVSISTDYSHVKNDAIGDKPVQSDVDMSVQVVVDYLNDIAQGIEYLEWSKVSSLGKNWVVRCKYKVDGNIMYKWFYIQNNKVVSFK